MSLAAAHFSAIESVVAEHLPLEHTSAFGELNVIERIHNVVTLLAVKVKELIPDLDAPALEEVIVFTISLYDKYVVDVDIPGVPNILEPSFDSAMRMLIRVLLTSILAKKN